MIDDNVIKGGIGSDLAAMVCCYLHYPKHIDIERQRKEKLLNLYRAGIEALPCDTNKLYDHLAQFSIEELNSVYQYQLPTIMHAIIGRYNINVHDGYAHNHTIALSTLMGDAYIYERTQSIVIPA